MSLMSNKTELMGIIVEKLLKRVDDYYTRTECRPIPWFELKRFVGRQIKATGGFDSLIESLLADKSIKLVTLDTGKRFIAPGHANASEIRPVRFTVKPD